MKNVLIIDHGERCPEEAVTLLRAHGYGVEMSMPGTAFRSEAQPIRTVEPTEQHPVRLDIHLSPDAILIARTSDGAVVDSNVPFVELTGYGHAELLGQNIMGPIFFLNPEFWTRAFRRLEAEGEVRDLETRILRKDGLVVFVLVSLRSVERDGMPCHVITIREWDSDALRGTMDRQLFFSDAALERLLAEGVDIDREDVGRLIDFQALQDLMNSFYKITRIGIGINDIMGHVQVATGWQDICTRFHRTHPETLRDCLESDIHLSRLLGKGEAIYKCKNGMWDLATPLVIGGRHIANIFLGQFLFEDEVPDYDFFRKQAEAYGFDVDEYLAALDRVPRWSHELVQNVMEFYKKLAMMMSRLSIGNIKLAQALAQQKRISEELQQANLLVENSPVMLFRRRAEEGWPVELVSANVTRFGYTKEELLSGLVPFSSLVHPDDLARVASEVGEYTAAGIDSFQQEYRIVAKGGEVRWIDDRTVIERDTEGRVTHYQGIIIDITERRRAEEAIHQSEEKFRTLFMSLNEGFYLSEPIYDDNGNPCDYRYLEVNPKFEQIMGLDRDQIIGKRYKELVSVDTTKWLDNYFSVALTGEPCTYEFYSNEYRMHFETYAYQPAKGQVSVLIINVTERMRAEEALRESEEKFRVLAETSPTAIFLYQGEMIIYANPATERLFGYTGDELLRMRFWDWAHDDYKETVRARGLARQRKGAVSGRYESRFVTKNGEDRWLVVSAGPIEYQGRPAGIASFLDISEIKRSEELLRDSLSEKIVLLKEVHHRVKNNLQIISSLLDLQSDSITDEESRRFIRESRNRITSMALVHEKLYQSESFASIKLVDYIESLTQHLLNTLVRDPSLIALTIDVGDLSLRVDEAIPCGLIVNELVSNSLKHAFPAGGKGEISIRCRSEEDGRVTLTVADTGPGLPPGLDFRNTETLGLQLVSMLVQQLRGTVEVGGMGTTFVIRFTIAYR